MDWEVLEKRQAPSFLNQRVRFRAIPERVELKRVGRVEFARLCEKN
jgi:hypothetical protein